MVFKKGDTPWNKNKKIPYIPHFKMRGHSPWNKDLVGVQPSSRKDKTFEEIYGVEKSNELKQKMSESMKGAKRTEETKLRMSEAGKKCQNNSGRFKKGQPSPRKLDLDLNEIKRLYTVERLSTIKIAKIMGCSSNPIRDSLINMGIKRRTQKETTKEYLSKNIHPNKLILDEDYIVKKYNEGFSTLKIEKEIGVDHSVINRRLKELGVKIHKVGAYKEGFHVEIPKKELIEKYVNEGKDTIQIGKDYGVSYQAIKTRLKHYGIPIREFKGNSGSFVEGENMGEDSPNWLGGKSFEPYTKEFNIKFRRAIRKRDNQVCMICNIHREKLKVALSVHHINYDKALSIPQNCISLCMPCHLKTNYHRDKWTKFCQDILSERYGYEYNNQEIVLEVSNGER